MAVLLAPEQYDAWLDPQRKTGQLDLLKTSAYHEDELEYFPISRLVNNPGYDAPDILDASAGPEPPPTSKSKKSIELLLDL
jgi:putative SOS response-associated peptidase YedK